MGRLYGVYRSRATRPLWLAAEAGIALDLIPVVQGYRLSDPGADGAPMNTTTPEFLALSPQGAIPVYEAGALVLTESMAILLHLARDAGPFGPRDDAEAARMMQWAFYALSAVEAPALRIQYAADPDAAALKEAATALSRPLAVMDRHLSAQGHFVGGRFTAADIAVAECLRYAQPRTGLIEGHGSVQRWLRACQARPAFVAMMARRNAEPADPNP